MSIVTAKYQEQESGTGMPLRTLAIIAASFVSGACLVGAVCLHSGGNDKIRTSISGSKSIYIPDLQIEMIQIPSGLLPAEILEKDQSSQRGTSSSKSIPAFFLGRTEVTRLQYAAYGMHRFSPKNDLSCPVGNVSWNEAIGFCDWLTKHERVAGRLPKGWIYTLPTEAQWEYACRAGSASPRPQALYEVSWYKHNSDGGLHPVATLKPNRWGLYDMLGNAWEWCRDDEILKTDALLSGANSLPTVTIKVNRGGSCFSEEQEVGPEARGRTSQESRFSSLGFRVALVPDPRPKQ